MAMSEEQLQNCAAEMAEAWLKSATEGDRNQITNQLAILEDAAIIILGHMAANEVLNKENKEGFHDCLLNINTKIHFIAKEIIEDVRENKGNVQFIDFGGKSGEEEKS